MKTILPNKNWKTILISKSKLKRKIIHLFSFAAIVCTLYSCRTVAPQLDYESLAKASIHLGIDISLKENHTLYLEADKWLGTPYLANGLSKNGVDCSGFTYLLYKEVYRKELPRSTKELEKKCHQISKHRLQTGDLVFFTSEQSAKQVAHVGIYLKDKKFIHASTSRGVIVSSLDEKYYTRHWHSGGKFN